MRLTRFTDNALRCLVYLAAAPRETATVRQIATGMQISPDHLLKVIRRLVQLRLLRTIRGRNGGVQLARRPGSIAVSEVIHATERDLALVPCFDAATNECPIADACVLARGLDAALGAFFAVLRRYTIADLVAGPLAMRAPSEALASAVSGPPNEYMAYAVCAATTTPGAPPPRSP